MGFQWRRSRSLGKNTRLNVSTRGVSVSRRFGPVTINSRGQVTIRLGKGGSFRL